MSTEQIQVSEKKSHPWLFLSLTSMVLALVLAWFYMQVADPFWHSMLPLPAFAAFAGGILSLTRVRSRHYDIYLHRENGELDLRFELRGKAVYTDHWSEGSITNVEIDRPLHWIPEWIIYGREYHVIITDARNGNRYALFDINGRLLPLDKANAEAVTSFLKPLVNAEGTSRG